MAKQLQVPELTDAIQNSQAGSLRLYLVSRALKPDVPKTKKTLHKYLFNLHRIDIDPALQGMFLKTILELGRTLSAEYDRIAKYKPIDVDSRKIHTYQMTNREMAFADVIYNQINRGVDMPTINDLDGYLRGAELWAYCIEMQAGDNNRYLSFTRLNRGKVAVDERTQRGTSLAKKFFRTRFNTNTAKLELLDGTTVNFDERVDCLYLFAKDTFYIFDKKHFEQIVAIEEEFRKVADSVMKLAVDAEIVGDLTPVQDILDNDTAVHKKLYQLGSVLKEEKISPVRLRKMQAVAKSYKLPLRVKGGKVQIGDRNELVTFIRLLDDYFLESPQTGYKYGAPVKERLNV